MATELQVFVIVRVTVDAPFLWALLVSCTNNPYLDNNNNRPNDDDNNRTLVVRRLQTVQSVTLYNKLQLRMHNKTIRSKT